MTEKKLIHFNSDSDYQSQKNDIDGSSIVFVKDSHKIATHGAEYQFQGWSVLTKINPWEQLPNGVYAVSADGKPVEVANADASCIAVAFISDNQKVMIAKADATDGTNTTLYWGYNLNGQDVPNLEYLANATAAKADYNGKANTAAIIAGYAALGKDMDSRDMCKVLETYNEGGYTEWYVPAAGQLYEFYFNKAALNEALAAISGTAFASVNYWSSSEESASDAWRVSFNSGDVYHTSEGNHGFVRFVRDIN